MLYRFTIAVIVTIVPIVFCLVHTVYAQENMLSTKISIDLENVKLENALKAISDTGKITFSYSSKIIPVNEKVTIHARQESLKKVLDQLFHDFDIEYLIVEGKLILRQRVSTNGSNSKENVKEKPKFTIKGFLSDKENGENLIGASIYIKEINNGTVTNTYGFYSITLPKGDYTLNISYLGYKSRTFKIRLTENTTRNIELENQRSILKEIIITPDDSIQLIENLNYSATGLHLKSIKEQPTFMGEYDVIKSMESLSGVQLFRDGSSFFHVRGGNYDQNQILLDEAPIYNPSHMLGLFGTFIPEAVKKVKLYKGDFPADMGGRISSVVAINTKEGNRKSFDLHGSLGLLSARVAAEGPIIKEKSSYFISARKSHIKAFAQMVEPKVSELLFYDINTKVNFQFNENNHLYFSAYIGEDKFIQNEESGINWSNKAATLRWNHVFSEKFFANTTLYTSNYVYDLIPSISKNNKWRSFITNGSLKSDFAVYINPYNTIKFGTKISGHNFNPGNIENGSGESPSAASSVPKKNAVEATLYATHEWQISDKWLFNYGLRYSTWSNSGNTIEYQYDDSYNVVDTLVYEHQETYNVYTNPEPRIELIYNACGNHTFKLNYNRTAQYINLISNSLSPFSSLEVWVPAGPNIKPQVADQLSIGWFSSLLDDKLKVDIEGYYKWMKHQIDYMDHANLFLNPFYEGSMRSGKGKAYGIEAMLKKDYGRLSGRLSYTYSRTFKTIKEINNGQRYPTLWDRPHQIGISANWKASKKSRFSGNILISTGAPVTTPTSFYYYRGRSVPVYTKRNNERMPTYHRFDLAYTWQLNKPGNNFTHSLTFSVFNLYGRKNNVLENFNKVIDANGDPLVPGNVTKDYTLTSTKIYVYDVIPSITYNFSI